MFSGVRWSALFPFFLPGRFPGLLLELSCATRGCHKFTKSGSILSTWLWLWGHLGRIGGHFCSKSLRFFFRKLRPTQLKRSWGHLGRFWARFGNHFGSRLVSFWVLKTELDFILFFVSFLGAFGVRFESVLGAKIGLLGPWGRCK